MGSDAIAKSSQTDITAASDQVQHYYQQSASLLLYQSVLEGAIGQAFIQLLETLLLVRAADSEAPQISKPQTTNKTPSVAMRIAACHRAYGQWFLLLAAQQQSWQQYLVKQIVIADNPFSQQAQHLAAVEQPTEGDLASHFDPGLLAAARHDLSILHSLYDLSAKQVSMWITAICGGTNSSAVELFSKSNPSSPLPTAFSHDSDWATALGELVTHYRDHGIGLFGQFAAFRWQSDAGAATGQLVGIPIPDPIRLSQLVSYDHPKQQLIQNTESLLRGYTAQNVLLYGSRGAGKSSLVKALLNEYRDRGLRLIEVPKASLPNLPQILEPLSRAPQKFIIFVDDLSFEDDDEDFKALKVVLEGGITARPQNVVVYATSNRRHLIREFFDERPRPKDADEIQAWDTVQEKLSFSDRFGLTLTFSPADQPTYLTIVRELAAQAGLNIEPDNLDWRARQWATRHNGRSGRTARQFIDFLIAEQGLCTSDL